ncbi:MAG: hypothetical protein QOH88_678 [Verrucomicrobiota bacterium]|jgi:hypothetical protein
MNQISSLRAALAAATLFLLATGSLSWGQIVYVRVDANGGLQLRQTNADGSGDSQFVVPFSTFVFPTWSRDAARLALTASDPSRPNERGQNVFSINPATGAIQQVTAFNDFFDPSGVIIYSFPYYKAFSPDRGLLATNSYIQHGATNGAGTTTTPVLEVYSTGAFVNPLQVHVDKGRNGKHHGGEGVDWSPTQNVLVAPVEATVPFQSGGGPGEVTTLYLMDPVDAAVQKGRFRQLTFPRADGQSAGNSTYLWGEHDYQPKFSPNGQGVAYVRSFQNHFLLSNPNPEPDVQALRIVNVNTGADTKVLDIPQGFYVSALDWSPDGSQLVFDVGQQPSSPVGPLQQARPETVEIYTVSVGGGNPVKLRGPGTGTPAWRPAVAQPPIVFSNIATRMRVGAGDNAMIGGFIITGNVQKKVIIRGMGPSLSSVGVQGVLSNPVLELFQGNTLIASNDDWQQAPNTNEIPNGFAPSNARESVIVTTLSPGNYTAVVRGAGGESGIGIVETYDLTPSTTSKLGNISTRGFVESGDNAMIGGLILTGGSARVIVRAMGPSLRNVGITNPLLDPTLQLINSNGATVAFNDDWQQAPNTNEIPNGFAPTDQRESVIVQALAAGNYTAVVRGKGSAVGVGLVEVYNLQ